MAYPVITGTLSSSRIFHKPACHVAKGTLWQHGLLFRYLQLVVAPLSPGQIAFRLGLRDDSDVARARLCVRELCALHGFTPHSTEALATATSEIARNAFVHAGEGELTIGTIQDAERTGVVVTARDSGPGIVNVEEAMRDGYSTGNGLGLGLPSARRLVHEFEIHSVPGEGTAVTMVMWSIVSRRSALR